MATHPHWYPRSALSLAALLAVAGAATAQTTVTITGRNDAVVSIGGYGETLARSPLQGAVFGAGQLRDAGVGSLAGLARLEPGVSDSYNSEGYWSMLSARGFVLDNRSNYRRDGLPINAETAIALGNKERLELLKGTSGVQAGTSSPGGLVNLVVKRPVASLHEASLEWSERGNLTGALDWSERFGTDGQFGARLNASASQYRPQLRSADGHGSLLALALDWQSSPEARLEFELESSRKAQPSQPGFSLLGNRLPDAHGIDPRINLNNQPWSQPVVLNGDTVSLRWQRTLAPELTLTMHGASQHLKSDDRVAFPYGCSNAGPDVYYADRYCPDGSFDFWDFRSDGERRRVDALDVHLDGRLSAAGMQHRWVLGLLATNAHDRFHRQANNYAGPGTIDGTAITAAQPELTDENTHRDERSREVYLRDTVQLGAKWQLWVGMRHTRLERQSVRTDGSRPTDYRQSFTTPWLALAYSVGPGTLAYVSTGQGVETEVVPNKSLYLNRGEPLSALKSRQFEAGLKHAANGVDWSLDAFDIRRPLAADLCDSSGTACTRAIDGAARHRGVEANAGLRSGPWLLRGGATWLRARREDSADSANNGLQPTNVPKQLARMQITRELGNAASITAAFEHEGRRTALPDNGVWLGAWTRLDLATLWQTLAAGHTVRWRVGVDNVTDRRAWRESPYQFGHAYLFPLAPRTWRASVAASF